jgi:hypothetical protein
MAVLGLLDENENAMVLPWHMPPIDSRIARAEIGFASI